MPQFTYRQVSDLYNTLQKAGVVSEGLPSWSGEMNRLTGTDLYGQGLNDSWVKQGSAGIDRLLEATGLPNVTASAGREVGSWIGAPDQGEAIGRGLPRAAVNFAPLLLGATPLAPLALPAVGALSGAEAYTNTGSVASGVISGATNVAMPGVAGLAERAALRALGGRVLSGPIADSLGNVLPGALGYVDNKLDATLAQRAGSFLAGQGAAAGLGEVGSGLEAAFDPNRDYSFDPKSMLLNMTLGQLPFAAAHLAGSAFKARGPYSNLSGDAVSRLLEESRVSMEKKVVDDATRRPSALAQMPDVEQIADPVAQAKTSALLAATRDRKKQLEDAGTLETDPDASEEYAKLNAAELAAMNESETSGGTGVMGESVQPESDRFLVSGTEHFYNPKTGYRIVKVGSDPGNVAAGFTPGQLIGYSTKFEPPARPMMRGDTAYSIPTRYHDPNVVDRTPTSVSPDAELPLQGTSGDRLSAVRQQAADFSAATDNLAKATDTEGLRQAAEAYNGIRQKYGYAPLTDKQFADYQKKVEAPTRKDAIIGLANTEKDVLDKRERNTKAKLQDEVDTFSRLTEPLRQKERGETVSDSDLADANAIQNMYQRLQGTQRAGTFTSAIRQWETTGKEGGIPRLQKLMEETIRQGGVKAKPSKAVQATADAAADPSPDTQEVRNVRQAVAGDAAATYITEPADHAAFVESYLDGTIVQGKFLNDPEWRQAYDDANSEMERLGVHEPERSAVPEIAGPKPYVPITDAEREKLDSFGADSGGASIINQLKSSTDPITRELAETLEKNYPESLKRIFVRILDQSHEGSAGRVGSNESEIRLSHALVLGTDKVRQEQVYTHELLHGLTLNELANPSKVQYVNELTALRERLINQLPEGLKSKMNSLIDSDWHNRYARSEPDTQISDLHQNQDWQQVMYGLLNNDELVTQGFSSKPMQRFMQNFKGPSKSGFGDFVSWVRRIVGFAGKTSDSEFANFLETTSNVLRQGNYVSDVSNFFKTYLGQKEGNPTVVRNQGRRALGLVQSANVNPSRTLLLSQLMSEEPVSRDYQQAKLAMQKMDEGDASVSRSVLGELGGSTESLDHLLENHLDGNTSGSMEDAMDLLPQPVTDYLFARAKDMRDVTDAVRAASSAKNEGLVNLADPKVLRKPIGETLEALDKFLSLQKTQESNRQSLSRFTQAVPDAYLNSVLAGPSRAPEVSDAVADAVGAPKTSDFERWLSPMAQLARKDPRFAEYFGRLLTLPARIRQMASASTTVMSRKWDPSTGTLGQEYDKGTLDQMYKALESGPMKKALDQLLYLKQIRGKDKVNAIDYRDPEVASILGRLSEKDRNAVIEFDNKSRVAKIAQDAVSLDTLKRTFSMRDARIAMLDNGWKLGPSLEAATNLFDALSSDFSDPQQSAIAQQQMAAVRQKMQGQPFNNLLQSVQASVAQHKLLGSHMAANPDWVTNKRGGDYLFDYRKNGKLLSDSADNLKEAIAIAGSKDAVLNWKKNEKDPDSIFDFGNATPDMITKVRQYETNQLENQIRSGATPEQIAKYKRDSLADQIERDVNAAGKGSVATNLKGRTLAKTDESFPWFENHIDWFNRNANYYQRRLMRETAESLASEPGTKDTEVADTIRQHMEQFLSPDPEAGRTIQKIASSWALGYSLAGNIANATQTWMRGVTELIALGHGPIAATREMAGAWGDLIGKRLEDKPYRSKLEENFMTDAQHDGMLSTAMRDEEAAADELQTETFKRVLNKEKPLTMGQRLSSAAGAYTTGGMALWKMGDYANNKAQLLASFRTLQKLNPEMSYEDLKKQSYLVNASVNDVGGRANRPVGPYSGKDQVTQTLAMTMMSLRSYTLGSTMQLIRHLKSGAFRPSGVTPAEVYSARKAAVYQLGVQFAAAGALGLPFASASLALLNQFFPELEVNKKVRESVSSLFGSDSQNGHILSDMALSGVPSMLGWDFSSRLNANNLLPGVTEYNGFQPEQLLGVPANLVGNFVRGVTKGQPGNFIPPAFKKIAELVGEGGQAKDYRGRPILQPTLGETLGLGLGFQPKRLVDYNTADRLAQAGEHLEVVRKGQENQQLAEQTLKGNFGTVRAALQDKVSTDKTYNPASAVRQIAQAAEDQTFPKDLRREGTAATGGSRSQLLGTFNIDPSNPSEVERLKFRKQIEQRLGLNTSDPSELATAQLMDQLRAAQPNATRAELRSQVMQALRRRPQAVQLQ